MPDLIGFMGLKRNPLSLEYSRPEIRRMNTIDNVIEPPRSRISKVGSTNRVSFVPASAIFLAVQWITQFMPTVESPSNAISTCGENMQMSAYYGEPFPCHIYPWKTCGSIWTGQTT